MSDVVGQATLFIPENSHGGSSPEATIFDQKLDLSSSFTENIATETLDSYCSKHNIEPNFLKIDVEGNELKVFKGGIETLKKHKPKIIVEIEARHVGQKQVLETFIFLETIGYSGFILHGTTHIPLSEFSFEKYQNTSDKENYSNNFIFE